jgi:hypothetical protein
VSSTLHRRPDSPLLGWGTPGDDEQLLPLNKHSNAYAASLVVKSGPGILYGFTVYNSAVAAQFIGWYDSATVPADGVAPDGFITVATVASNGIAWLPGRTFHTGIVLCNSSTGPTKTLGVADCYFDAQYV